MNYTMTQNSFIFVVTIYKDNLFLDPNTKKKVVGLKIQHFTFKLSFTLAPFIIGMF